MQDHQISPTEIITNHKHTELESKELFLVTGDSGTGKTTWCLELLRQASAAGIKSVGLISPAVFEQGIKTAIDLVNISSGERRRLAVKRGEADPPRRWGMDTLPGGTMGWIFNPETLAWGNQVLESLQAGEILILDELGPLELLESQGLTSGIELINRRSFQLACVVVRPRLLVSALERWPWARVINVAEHTPEVVQK